MRKIYDLIKDVMIQNPNTRNSDKELLLNVWNIQGLIILYGEDETYMNMKDWYIKGISSETIRRCRQSIQHDFPELRGSKEVQERRSQIAEEKGTHIFRETFDI